MKGAKIKLQKMEVLAVIVSVIGMAVACGSKQEEVMPTETSAVQEEVLQEETLQKETEEALEEAEVVPEETETLPEQAEDTVVQEYSLAELVALLGMPDAESAECFGGGEENWTDDGGFYIGRIYEVPFYGEKFPVYTSCDEEKIVNAVSVWLADGEKAITQAEAQKWVERITSYAEVEPTYHDAAESEAEAKYGNGFLMKFAYRFIGPEI